MGNVKTKKEMKEKRAGVLFQRGCSRPFYLQIRVQAHRMHIGPTKTQPATGSALSSCANGIQVTQQAYEKMDLRRAGPQDKIPLCRQALRPELAECDDNKPALREHVEEWTNDIAPPNRWRLCAQRARSTGGTRLTSAMVRPLRRKTFR